MSPPAEVILLISRRDSAAAARRGAIETMIEASFVLRRGVFDQVQRALGYVPTTKNGEVR
jgi:hypothetical protein